MRDIICIRANKINVLRSARRDNVEILGDDGPPTCGGNWIDRGNDRTRRAIQTDFEFRICADSSELNRDSVGFAPKINIFEKDPLAGVEPPDA